MSKEKFSVRKLSKETGADRASISKWTAGCETEEQARAVIAEHQAANKPKGSSIDPATGLTWFQAKLQEETLRIRRENEQAEAIKHKRWIEVADVSEMLKRGLNSFEQIPNKARSELGLTDAQSKAIQRMIDEARSSWAEFVTGKATETTPKEKTDEKS